MNNLYSDLTRTIYEQSKLIRELSTGSVGTGRTKGSRSSGMYRSTVKGVFVSKSVNVQSNQLDILGAINNLKNSQIIENLLYHYLVMTHHSVAIDLVFKFEAATSVLSFNPYTNPELVLNYNSVGYSINRELNRILLAFCKDNKVTQQLLIRSLIFESYCYINYRSY